MNKMKLLLTLAIPVVVLSQDAQAQSTRLTAQAHWTHNGAEFKRFDSTAYNYLSTSRGGDLKSLLKFDEANNWSFTAGDTQNNNMRTLQEFDASNNLTTKVTQEWDGLFTLSWVNKFKYIYTYNSSNKKANMITQHWDGTSAWITDSRNAYSYNSANQLYQDQFQLWDGIASYVPSSQTLYYYDIAGNVINETHSNFVASSPVFSDQTNYTYNSANKMLTSAHSTWNGASWDNTELFTYTYDSSNNRTTALHQNYDGTAYVNDMLSLFSDFTGGNPQTEIAQSWDTTGSGSWANTYKYAYTYNSNRQMTSSTRQSNDISIGWTYTFGDTKANYYYGSFVNSVKNVSNAGGTATLFPVPSQGTLNISINWTKAQSSTVTVMDLQGRVVKTVSVPTATQHTATVSVADLANGTYMVNINGTNGSIVKQIVVAN